MKYALLTFTALTLALPAHADSVIMRKSSIKKSLGEQQAPTVLTEDSVRQYYADQVASLKAPYEDYLAFARQGFSDNFVSRNMVTVIVPGQPEKVERMDKTKNDLVNMDPATQEIGRTANIDYTIDKITIDANSNTARVTSRTDLTLTAANAEGQTVAVKTASECNDVLDMADGLTRMLESTCTATTEIGAPHQ